MIKYRKETVSEMVPSVLTCDICKKVYDCITEPFETQEFQHIKIDAGYESIFGDGNKFEVDICQHCFKKLLGEYLRKVKE